MPFDPVPFFVGGGAVHSPEVARTLAYAATGGAQGVVTPGDLKVTATAVPGSTVQVAPGAVVIVNRAAAQTNQSYVARVSTADSVAVSPTNSSGGRTDLIVAQIEDPWLSGEPWQDPANPAVGPYVFTRVIPNVPVGTTRLQDVSGYEGRTAVTLARVTIPANTATITNAMITDLRSLARPRSERQIVAGTPTDATVTLSTGAWLPFPTTPITGIVIPSWATHAAIRTETTIKFISGDAYANYRMFMGPAGQQPDSMLYSDMVIDATATTSSNQYRQPFIMPSNGYWQIPPALRGTTVQISGIVRAKNQSGGKIGTAASDYYFADITFMERTI